MVVDTSLTEAMLQRLTRIADKYRESGDLNDPTRLCKLWKGALREDKDELERLVTDIKLAGKLSAGRIKEEYPKYRIYTTGCIQNAIGNYRKKAKKETEDRDTSKKSFDSGSSECCTFLTLSFFVSEKK